MALKMEAVEAELKSWGELMITTEAGDRYEIHLGDTVFDYSSRTITLKGPSSQYVIAGDSVEAIEKHYGHRMSEEDH